jgi:hypothetical protein
MKSLLLTLHEGEDGHFVPALASLVAAAGPIVLAIGATKGNDALTITGGIIAAVGVLVALVAHHMVVDWELFRRTTK